MSIFDGIENLQSQIKKMIVNRSGLINSIRMVELIADDKNIDDSEKITRIKNVINFTVPRLEKEFDFKDIENEIMHGKEYAESEKRKLRNEQFS